jgi:hypothetical protein
MLSNELVEANRQAQEGPHAQVRETLRLKKGIDRLRRRLDVEGMRKQKIIERFDELIRRCIEYVPELSELPEDQLTDVFLDLLAVCDSFGWPWQKEPRLGQTSAAVSS